MPEGKKNLTIQRPSKCPYCERILNSRKILPQRRRWSCSSRGLFVANLGRSTSSLLQTVCASVFVFFFWLFVCECEKINAISFANGVCVCVYVCVCVCVCVCVFARASEMDLRAEFYNKNKNITRIQIVFCTRREEESHEMVILTRG